MFERAVSRANLPIRFSQGFNPRPKLRLLLPRPVSVASDDELLIAELERPEVPGRVLQQLANEMPGGIVLREAFALAPQSKPRPIEAAYRLDLAGQPHQELSAAAQRVTAADRLPMERPAPKGGKTRAVDLRPWIRGLEVTPHALTMTLSTNPEGSARPVEVLELLGLPPQETAPQLRRVSVCWNALIPEQPSPEFEAQVPVTDKGRITWEGNES